LRDCDYFVDVLIEDLHIVFVGIVDSKNGLEGSHLLRFPKNHLHSSSTLSVLFELVDLASCVDEKVLKTADPLKSEAILSNSWPARFIKRQ
jgi:hypothetical protein